MLIQAFCTKRENVSEAVRMIYNHFRSSIDFFELSLMQNINEGYYNITPFEDLSALLLAVDQEMNPDLDNVGVYYNEGRKIFVRIFKNAKFDVKAYTNEPQKT